MASRFDLSETQLAGLTVIKRKPIADTRGYLERVYCAEELKCCEIEWAAVQVNRTLTKRKGTVRGLHFQRPPYAEIKLVSCLRGCVFDVAVDLRLNSPTYLQWFGVELSGDNRQSLLIPQGFAHGFQTQTDDCELLYLHSKSYQREAEDGINAQDETIAVKWSLPIVGLSVRDAGLPIISNEFEGVSL